MIVSKSRLKKQRQRLLLITLAIHNNKSKRLNRRQYIREIFTKRMNNGEVTLLDDLDQDPMYHKRYFRMSKECFEDLHRLVAPKIKHSQKHIFPISTKIRLAITLRYLATGCSQVQLALSYRVSPSSVCQILRETTSAIINSLKSVYLPEPNHDMWIASEKIFTEKWNFPLCVGAIDGKHVRMRAPWNSGSVNFNYKGYFSTSVMAIVSGDCRFLVVEIGAPGSESDAAIFARSSIFKKITEKRAMIPENGQLGENVANIPRVIVGDEAYPLKPWLMRPFPGRELNLNRRIYNFRLSRARRVVENAFGIWAARWRILHSPIDCDSDLVRQIILSTMILHNMLRVKADEEYYEDQVGLEGITIPGNWRMENDGNSGLVDVPRVGSNNYSAHAFEIRESFVTYFCSDGWLQGQDHYVMRS